MHTKELDAHIMESTYKVDDLHGKELSAFDVA